MIAAYIIGLLGLVGIGVGIYFALRLYRWERFLQAQVAVFYKGKLKMDPTLIELISWAMKLAKDERGRQFFKMGQVTLAIVKPKARSHGKTETKTIEHAA